MLRISRLPRGAGGTTLKVEGRVAGDGAEVLDAECQRALAQDGMLHLDLGEVYSVDTAAIAMLRSLPADRVTIVNMTPFLEARLLRELDDDD